MQRDKKLVLTVWVSIVMIASAFSGVMHASMSGQAQLSAQVTFEPEVLNSKSMGKWITALVELPPGYDVSAIDVTTIVLNDVVPAEVHPTQIGDHDGDGVPDLMVKFPRGDAEDMLMPGINFLSVKGELTTGEHFEGMAGLDFLVFLQYEQLGMARHVDTSRDAEGNLHMVWQEPVGGQYEVFYANNIGRGRNMGVGNDWNPSIRSSYTPDDSVWPDIGIDTLSGMIFITWTEETIEGDMSFYTISRDGGNVWLEPNFMVSDILLKADVFDPLEEEPDIPKDLKSNKGEGYYLVQFTTPTFKEWIDGVENTGGEIYGYIPNNAFIVGMNDNVKINMKKLPFVRWIGIYQPAYRLSSELSSYALGGGDGSDISLDISVFANVDDVEAQIVDLGGDVKEKYPTTLRVTVKHSMVKDITFLPDISWVQKTPDYKLHNEFATAVMNVPLTWGIHGLIGTGQVVALADSGLDNGNIIGNHPDFGGRIDNIYSWGDTTAADVNSGHGTHVAGSVVGNGAMSGGFVRGVAYDAHLVFQAMEVDATRRLFIPADLNTLFQQAYDDASHPRIHTNSWGHAANGDYDASSQDVDEFMWNNKDMLILFSAGNAGVDFGPDGIRDSGDEDGEVDPDSIGAPGTAKNCITVGASENLRPGFTFVNNDLDGNPPTINEDRLDLVDNDLDGLVDEDPAENYGAIPRRFPDNPLTNDFPSNDIRGMAAFSSRGPTDDLRIKPDVVAPGTWIRSTLSSMSPGAPGWGSGLDNQFYQYMSGTSMATPLTAGTAVLTRQFYVDNEGIVPSGALIKATLINGAVDLPGQYNTGGDADGNGAAESIPNEHEGWGRVDMTGSLFPTAPRFLEYEDVTPGFAMGAGGTPDVYRYTVSPGEPLKVTLVWTDYFGQPTSARTLVNNLDLRVTAPDGNTVYRGNVFAQGESATGGAYDTVNNVENVLINIPQDGEYTVEVIPTSINMGGFQPYSLVVQGGAVTESGWVRHYNGPDSHWDQVNRVAVDPLGNVHVAGFSTGVGTGWDYTTIKYDADGNELWTARYNGPGNGDDTIQGLDLDSQGNVYVTGYSPGIGTGDDFATIKYDSNGNELWVRRFTSFGNGGDRAWDLAVDSLGNVVVTGSSPAFSTDMDFMTLKYDTNGNPIWMASLNGPGNSNDRPVALAMDSSGNVHVTGWSYASGASWDYLTVKYDTNGNKLWDASYSGPGSGSDRTWDVDVDSSGNVYITGESEGSGGEDDLATIKYDSSGTELWVARYSGPTTTSNFAQSIEVDSSGKVYVLGHIGRGVGDSDLITIKYDSMGGKVWDVSWDGPGNGIDIAWDMALDASDNVYITGSTDDGSTRPDIATISYDPSGAVRWEEIFNGPTDGYDAPRDLALDSSGNVYIAGLSEITGNERDCTTIKYLAP